MISVTLPDGHVFSDPPREGRALEGIGGWFDGAPVRGDDTPRPQGHGSFGLPAHRGARLVQVSVSVSCAGPAEAGLAQEEFTALLAGGGFGEVSVSDPAGRVTSARVRLGSMPLVRWMPRSDVVRAQFEFFAPDPLRYGEPVSEQTTFPELRGGLRYDLYTDGAGGVTGWLDYGEPSSMGRVALVNRGTADVPVTLQVSGPVPEAGFDVVQVATDRRLTFEGGVGAGSVLVLDGATGAVLLDGVADRGGRLTWRDWPTVPAGGSLELAFLPRGERTDAVLTAVMRPGWW